ncbi:hypothetical protein D9M71_466630 [compost metagenome]
MGRIGDHPQLLLVELQAVVGIRALADAGAADGEIQAALVDQPEQAGAGVFHHLHRQLRLGGAQAFQAAHQQRYRAHDRADRQAPALALEDADHLFPQMRQVGMDQARVTNGATPEVVGFQALAGALEQAGAEGCLDFVERLGGAGLGDGDLLGGLVQGALFIQGDEQAQLFQAQAGNQGGEGGDHGDDGKLSLDQELSLGRLPGDS